MKYLEMAIKESMRIYPPVPIFARQLMQDAQYGKCQTINLNFVFIVQLYRWRNITEGFINHDICFWPTSTRRCIS